MLENSNLKISSEQRELSARISPQAELIMKICRSGWHSVAYILPNELISIQIDVCQLTLKLCNAKSRAVCRACRFHLKTNPRCQPASAGNSVLCSFLEQSVNCSLALELVCFKLIIFFFFVEQFNK